MLLRRGLLSKQVSNIVTIPLTTDFTASNGALPSVNSGCSLTASGLYIPSGGFVEYRISDLCPKDFKKITLSLDMKYTKTAYAHGWFVFFESKGRIGIDKNVIPRDRFRLFDIMTQQPVPLGTWLHVKIVADFSLGVSTIPQCEIVDIETVPSGFVAIAKPSRLVLGTNVMSDELDGWEGYVKNVKITFD